ncbi:hypothetical protein [Phenylobacterium sp. SCN 70-31]|uniref:DUF4350 domain-containing protein n=1 Tax=Phenylobacterium sp. SCN 70-31 TaxID=1660129 RepID=UPI00086E25C3|nr:hypothetical protein [Phenylobacterium sp. SCN 70-31]ODT86849.1 MAG: hypothetical protein ABS78_14475 [Phenylobacterium sp. SCN 70-31]
MSEAPTPAAPAFRPRTILALIGVGVVAFAAMAVLAAYAPDLRSGNDGRAHAMSRSAIGFAAAPILARNLGETASVSRSPPRGLAEAVVVVTPEGHERTQALDPFAEAAAVLIVMPKWAVSPDPLRRGAVRKVDVRPARDVDRLLSRYAKATRLTPGSAVTRPILRGAGGPFDPGTVLPLGPIDRLQTVTGEGWAPALVNEKGEIVLAYAVENPKILLLADPDLLNNQGLAELANARAGAAILSAASAGGERPILFDVTLNGLARGRGLGRLMLEPPWLAATLIGLAATVLMALHALARFGQPRREGRAFALGAGALVDNSADLIRMARKEAEFAPAYAGVIRRMVIRAGGGHAAQEHWLDDLARRRGVASPDEMAAEAQGAKTRDDLLGVARKLYDWKGELTRDRR